MIPIEAVFWYGYALPIPPALALGSRPEAGRVIDSDADAARRPGFRPRTDADESEPTIAL